MKIVSLTGKPYTGEGTSIALGMFDGVHIGHRRIISAAKNKSTEIGIPASVLLFSESPHGASELLPLSDRLCELEALGVDFVFVYDFEEIKGLSPIEFVKGELFEKLGAKAVSAGYNYRFGAKAAGDSEMLTSLAKECGIECEIVGRVDALGDAVSSTRIRELLANGDVETANDLLGYEYYLKNEVVHGKELGRQMGIPTANLFFHDKAASLAHGIYYTKTEIDEKEYISVSNVGIRPTVENTERVNLETHILDFDGDVYGKTVKVRFCGRGRGERTFENVDALKKEIATDCQRARDFFEK